MRWQMLWDLLTGRARTPANPGDMDEVQQRQAWLEREVRELERAAALRMAERARENAWRQHRRAGD